MSFPRIRITNPVCTKNTSKVYFYDDFFTFGHVSARFLFKLVFLNTLGLLRTRTLQITDYRSMGSAVKAPTPAEKLAPVPPVPQQTPSKNPTSHGYLPSSTSSNVSHCYPTINPRLSTR